jgi:hypothetical protein
MRPRIFIISVLALLMGYWIPVVWQDWQEYKEERWKASPVYQYQMRTKTIQILRNAAHVKYINRFKPAARAFGKDMKFLEKIEGYPGSEALAEHYKEKLYHEQYTLMRQWLFYDTLLFPDRYNAQQAEDFYRNYVPRRI